jgi:signal transduction histidine kinase
MPEPIGFTDYVLLLLGQFTGGPGPKENNLVRFGLAAVFWLLLLIVAWTRQRHRTLPRERLLVWGFGLAFARELFMFSHTSAGLLGFELLPPASHLSEPLEHALTMAAIIVVAAAFLRFILDQPSLARRFMQAGLATTAVMFAITWWWWRQLALQDPGARFNRTWGGTVFFVATGIFAAVAILFLLRKKGWLSSVVSLALGLFVLVGIFRLVNFSLSHTYDDYFCRVCNGLHMLAIPILGYVYLREQSIEKDRAEQSLAAYRDHLEEIVEERTTELTRANERLQVEIRDRERAQMDVNRRNAELAAQNSIAATVSGSLDLDRILAMALETVIPALEMDAGCVCLIDPESGALVLQSERGEPLAACLGQGEGEACRCPGVTEEALGSARPVVLNLDGQSGDPREGLSCFRTLVSTPIISRDRALGALSLASRQPEAISPGKLNLLAAIGQQIGVAVENARLYQQTGRWAEDLALLHASSTLLTGTLDPTTIYSQVSEQTAMLLGCQAAVVMRWNEERQDAAIVFARGVHEDWPADLVLKAQESRLLADLLERQATIAIRDAHTDERLDDFWRQRLHAQAMLCIPLLGKDEPIGFMFFVDQRAPRLWRTDEVSWAESFAGSAALSLEKAYLYSQVERVATLEERQRIAAEMHDGLAQILSYLALKADYATDLLQDGQVPAVLEQYRDIQAAIERATREVRMSITSLRSDPQPREPLQSCVERAAIEAAHTSAQPISFVNRLPSPLFLMPDQQDQVQRVVQEALANAVRHAHAQRIGVFLEQQGSKVMITVSDDGRGFDLATSPPPGDHFGLSIMRARAARIGGQLFIDSLPGQGTRVLLAWPLHPGQVIVPETKPQASGDGGQNEQPREE